MHDIGNMINRHDHAQTGALLTFQILKDMGMDPQMLCRKASDFLNTKFELVMNGTKVL